MNIKPDAMAQLQSKAAKLIETDALGGLNKALACINESLDNLEKSKNTPTFPLHQGNLKALKDRVHFTLEYIENCLLAHAVGKGGFENDPTGLFKGKSQWSKSEGLKKKYSFSHLVDEYAVEWKSSKTKDADGLSKGELISSTSAADVLNSTDSIVPLTLNNGEEVQFDREENLIGFSDKETGKISWFKSKYDLSKDWIGSVCSYIKQFGADVWKWLVEKYKSCVNFIFGEEELTA